MLKAMTRSNGTVTAYRAVMKKELEVYVLPKRVTLLPLHISVNEFIQEKRYDRRGSHGPQPHSSCRE
jgi:hypothetical protein